MARFQKTQFPQIEKRAEPIIIPRAEHGISRRSIHPNALKVLYRLHQAGYEAYLVGGCVRDLLLGLKPKDFDIATSAHPDEVKHLFRNCRLIGKRFRLAHILFGRDIIEVATFRTHHANADEREGKTHQGVIVRDNVYGTLADDVWRRDFSINALYYNIADFSVVDYTGGMADIRERRLHMIGDPDQRFREDPVRLLRAVRFIAKLDVSISPATERYLAERGDLLQHVSPARLYQEVIKIFQGGALLKTMLLLQKYHLLATLFPLTAHYFDQSESQALLQLALARTDERIAQGKAVSPAFVLAILLWYPLQAKLVEKAEKAEKTEKADKLSAMAYEKAFHHLIKQQVQCLTIPRFLQVAAKEICVLQYRLMQRRGKQPYRLIHHPRFRAAYDLLVLRLDAKEPIADVVEWWTRFIAEEGVPSEASLPKRSKRVRRPRRHHAKRHPTHEASS